MTETDLIKRDYYKRIMPNVRKAISEFKTEIGDCGKELRVVYLSDRLAAVQGEIDSIHARYEELTATDSPYINKCISTLSLNLLEKDLKKVQSELRYLHNGTVSSDSVTPEMIEVAREHPFENLVDIKNNKVLCPFHDDHNPSMGVKNNRYRCWACGETGDIIDFVMKRENITFPEAVNHLI